jgi:hypothetical protein
MKKDYILTTKKYLFIISVAIFFVLPLLTLAAPAVQPPDNYGLQTAANEAGFSATPQTPKLIVGKIINYALTFVGVIFLLLTIYAGFLWMTAGGNEETVKKAKKWLVNSIIGLAIVLAAYSITNFILLKFLWAT